jgi:hypothetical protein
MRRMNTIMFRCMAVTILWENIGIDLIAMYFVFPTWCPDYSLSCTLLHLPLSRHHTATPGHRIMNPTKCNADIYHKPSSERWVVSGGQKRSQLNSAGNRLLRSVKDGS